MQRCILCRMFSPIITEALQIDWACLWCSNLLFSLPFYLFSQNCIIESVHCALCKCHSYVYRTATRPLSDHPFYHFKGSVAHRPPLVHPDCPLELICTSTVPLRGHTTAVCVGSEAAETPSSSPLHGWNKRTRCTWIHTVRLSDTHWVGLHTSWSTGLQHGELPCPIFQDQDCRKAVVSRLWWPDARPTGCANRSKGSAYMPTAWEGVPGWLGQQGVDLKKDIQYSGSDLRYRMQTYYVNIYYDIVCQPTIS